MAPSGVIVGDWAGKMKMPLANLPKERTPKLLEPVKLGDLALRNRYAMSSLTRGRSGKERVANDMNAAYYADRAVYSGLILSEGTHTSNAGEGWDQSPSIYTEEHAKGWKKSVDAVHAKGALMVAQLWHCGRAGHVMFQKDGRAPPSASAIQINPEAGQAHCPDGEKRPFSVPRELSLDEVPDVLEEYRNAARMAKKAGFDGVEVHAANGYFLNCFLESKTNTRTDQYGGSIENRYRLLGEVLQAVFEVYPSTCVGVKISPNGIFNDMGSPDNIETYDYVLAELSKLDLAYLQVMSGLAFGFHEKCEAYTIERVREKYSGKIIANCGYTCKEAEEMLASGACDAISFGRPYIENPDLPYRWATGKELTPADASTWFTHDPKGYNDFPPADQE